MSITNVLPMCVCVCGWGLCGGERGLLLKEMQAKAEVEVVADDGNCNECANVAYLFGLEFAA